MRAVLTRVKSASVAINGEVVGKIGQGFLILLGVGPNDNEQTCRYLAEKALGLRVFEDENGKMNYSVLDVGGQVLLVSQFTLLAETEHGHRPSFTQAEEPQLAKIAYLNFAEFLKTYGVPVQMGVFGADMTINQCNDGPVTIVMEKKL